MIITELTAKDITAYIDMISKVMKLSVTLHGKIISDEELFRYNFHLNPYCRYIKSVCGNWDVCIKNQRRVYDKCKSGAFFGVCYAGVGEYVYPLEANGEPLGFISVSGFNAKDSLTKSKLSKYSKLQNIDNAVLSGFHDKYLNSDIPSATQIDPVIRPLKLMLETFYQQKTGAEHAADDESLYSKILRYIIVNHTQKLNAADIAQHFNYSVSTVSHLFKKNSGMSICGYILNLRMQEAKWLLENSNFSIIDISLLLGFSSAGYFSTVYKKTFGVPPKIGKRQRKESDINYEK